MSPRETVDESSTLPPPSVTMTAELSTPELEPREGTVFGVDLADPGEGASRRAFLVVHEGAQGRVLEVRDDDGGGDEGITIGRSSASQVVVDDPRVSRRHARVYRAGPAVYVEDQESRNGTRVNGSTLRSGRRVVASGDVVRVGTCEIIVGSSIREKLPEPSPPRPAVSTGIGVAVADAKMRDVFALAKQLAGGDTSILVVGEAGAGKKVVADQVHRWSRRADGPFVRVDCATLGDAAPDLEPARGGTLLLDGVTALSDEAQKTLFDALESRRVDVRVLAATDRDLPAEVAAKRFREDLYYAISAFTLRVPPLRERHAEIDLFAHLFLVRFAAALGRPRPELDDAAAIQLLRHEWPGNVRELRDAMRTALQVTFDGGRPTIDLDALPEAIRNARAPSVRLRV